MSVNVVNLGNEFLEKKNESGVGFCKVLAAPDRFQRNHKLQDQHVIIQQGPYKGLMARIISAD